MTNEINISTENVTIKGSFTGTITFINPEYDFGGFLRVWDKTDPDIYMQICKYFFPEFIENGEYNKNVNYESNPELVEKLNEQYRNFLQKVGMPFPEDIPLWEYNDDILEESMNALYCTDDMLSLVLGAVGYCLKEKNTKLLYDIFLDDVDENKLTNKFYTTITI